MSQLLALSTLALIGLIGVVRETGWVAPENMAGKRHVGRLGMNGMNFLEIKVNSSDVLIVVLFFVVAVVVIMKGLVLCGASSASKARQSKAKEKAWCGSNLLDNQGVSGGGASFFFPFVFTKL